MTRIKARAEGTNELDAVWGLRGAYYALFMSDYNRSMARVDPAVVELCRLRIAQMVESDADLALRYAPSINAGLTEEKIAVLTRYPTAEGFTDRERACLEFTEQFVMAPSSISDDDVARLQQHLTAEQFMYFVKALSVMDQFARANSAFRLAALAEAPSTMPDFVARHAIAA